MGSYLADTNVLLRLADPSSEQHSIANQALARLVAVLQAHAIEHLISFNTPDFVAFPFLSLFAPHQLNTPQE